MRLCSEPDCGRKYYCKGLCARHYNRMRALLLPERKKEYRRRDYWKNRQRYIEQAVTWNAKSPSRPEIEQRYREANKDRAAARGKRWRETFPERHAERQKRRECAKRHAMPAWAQELDFLTIYEAAKRQTAETGILHHVDHIVPLQGENVCGLHVPWNLRSIPAAENLAKGNRLIPSIA